MLTCIMLPRVGLDSISGLSTNATVWNVHCVPAMRGTVEPKAMTNSIGMEELTVSVGRGRVRGLGANRTHFWLI